MSQQKRANLRINILNHKLSRIFEALREVCRKCVVGGNERERKRIYSEIMRPFMKDESPFFYKYGDTLLKDSGRAKIIKEFKFALLRGCFGEECRAFENHIEACMDQCKKLKALAKGTEKFNKEADLLELIPKK